MRFQLANVRVTAPTAPEGLTAYDAVAALSRATSTKGPTVDSLCRTLELPNLRHRVRDFI